MTEVERLILSVESKGISKIEHELGHLHGTTEHVKEGFKKLIETAAEFGLVLGAVEVIKKTIESLVEATKVYEDFQARLVVATKSQEDAHKVWEIIEEDAKKTPFSVEQTTEAFINLVNKGLDPSERALKSYGNTAAGTNKTIEEVASAVALATLGMLRGLHEFGIKSASEGDKLALTFRGHTTVIANTAKAIEAYMLHLGENEFAGAMEARMGTLTATTVKLKDAWTTLWITISQQGAGSFLTETLQSVIHKVDELNAQLASGQLQAQLKAQGQAWGVFAGDARRGLGLIEAAIMEAIANYATLWLENESDVKDVFGNFPIYARSAFQVIIADAISFEKEFGIVMHGTIENAKTEFERFKEIGAATFSNIGKHFFDAPPTGGKPAVDAAYQQQLDRINIVADTKRKASQDAYEKELEANSKLNDDVLSDISDESTAKLKAQEENLRKAKELRDKYEEEKNPPEGEEHKDRLAGYKTGTGEAPVDLAKAKADAEKAAREATQLLSQRLNFLEQGLVGENQAVLESYNERKEIILKNTALTEQQKKDMILQALSQSIVSETEAVKQGYASRREFILSDTALTENAKTVLIKKLTTEREVALSKIEKANMDKRLDQASQFFGNIASIGSTFGKKGFEIAKAAAIAQATIDTYKAATGAYAALASIPYVGPALGIAAAAAAIVAGTARIAQIKAQTFAGAYEYGGIIPGGKYGLVGEAGPEFVRGPAVVASAAATAAARNGGGIRTVTVQNYGQPVQASSQQNGEDLVLILRPLLAQNKQETKREIAGEIGRGGGSISKNLEAIYGVRRGQ